MGIIVSVFVHMDEFGYLAIVYGNIMKRSMRLVNSKDAYILLQLAKIVWTWSLVV